MLPTQNITQGIVLNQEYYLPILVQSFLTDRKAGGLTPSTVKFYQKYLSKFLAYCEAQAVTQVTELKPDFLRKYLLFLGETHSPGGVHAFYRSIRAFLRWIEFDEIVDNWKNPIRKVKSPKVDIPPIKGVSLDDFTALLKTCTIANGMGKRDAAILLTLLDTGARVAEVLNINIKDANMVTGEILIPTGKSRKPRNVYFGTKTRQAIRAYLRSREDYCPALFVTDEGERLTYNGLRAILTRHSELAGLTEIPSAHDFRRTMALEFLRNGGDIYSLQRILGHASTAVLWRYLAQTDTDGQMAHRQFSPVDRLQR